MAAPRRRPAAACISRSTPARRARRSLAPDRLALFPACVDGTCRIGRDPRTSGCTPDGERHGVPGLYAADGSLPPTRRYRITARTWRRTRTGLEVGLRW